MADERKHEAPVTAFWLCWLCFGLGASLAERRVLLLNGLLVRPTEVFDRVAWWAGFAAAVLLGPVAFAVAVRHLPDGGHEFYVLGRKVL